jgi:cell wall-associated NlpC family hydrolase
VRSRFPRSAGASALLIGLILGPRELASQGIHAEIGRLFEADGWTTYRVGLQRGIAGPVAVALYGTHLREETALGRRHWGGGADLVLLRGRRSGPYLIGGLAGGFSSDSADAWWSSWSAGGGYQLVLGGAFALSGESRYRRIAPGDRSGVELSIRVGALFGGGGSRTRNAPSSPARADLPAAPMDQPARDDPRSPPDSPPERRLPPLATVATAVPAARPASAAVADSVVATALAALGTGYRLGGTSEKGFDCSGLIQHAYGQHGITLPRVSRDQAKEGTAVARELEALRPGDILTFAARGRRRITHVGLYLGEGRFVHSARGGVQISTLSASDPYGRWYWTRWVGARRIVENGS